MTMIHRIRSLAEYTVGAALVLVHLALAGRRLALVELLEPPGETLRPPAAVPPGPTAPGRGPLVSRASG